LRSEKTSFLTLGPIEGALSSPAKFPYLRPRIVNRKKPFDVVGGSAHCGIELPNDLGLSGEAGRTLSRAPRSIPTYPHHRLPASGHVRAKPGSSRRRMGCQLLPDQAYQLVAPTGCPTRPRPAETPLAVLEHPDLAKQRGTLVEMDRHRLLS
jgi:hypothetical protein